MSKLLGIFKFGQAVCFRTSPYLNKVLHDAQAQQFVLKLSSTDETATVTYKKLNGTLNLVQLLVPEDFRNLGIGQVLAKEVLDYCVENNIKVKLSCPFIKKFVRENPKPEYSKIIVQK